MTVLPTVRRQLEHAAHRQATTRRRRFPAWRATVASSTRGPSDHRRQRLGPGHVGLGLSVILTVAIAALAIALLGHRRTGPVSSPAAGLASRYGLDGDGIGDIRFGQKPATVVAGLTRLLGAPEGASTGQRPDGLLRSICRFDNEVDWVGLAERDAGLYGTNSVGLTVYFKHRRFVGYSYGPPWGESNTPLVRQGVMLLTSRGLGLDARVARAQRLYGRAFVVGTQRQGTPPNPRLQRLPDWHVNTPTGRLYGGIDSPAKSRSHNEKTIGSISAGSVPNTPCR
jgi:hypothetical protein